MIKIFRTLSPDRFKVVNNKSGPETVKNKEKHTKSVKKEIKLEIVIQLNMKTGNYLDLSVNLNKSNL